MKILLFCLFLSFSTYAQNFMMHMNIIEVIPDTTMRYECVKVIWGMRQDTIGFLWENHYPIYFFKKSYYKENKKSTRKVLKKYITILSKENKDKSLVLRDIFYNKWGELFLITIYVRDDMIIYISRIDGRYPHYFLQMTH